MVNARNGLNSWMNITFSYPLYPQATHSWVNPEFPPSVGASYRYRRSGLCRSGLWKRWLPWWKSRECATRYPTRVVPGFGSSNWASICAILELVNMATPWVAEGIHMDIPGSELRPWYIGVLSVVSRWHSDPVLQIVRITHIPDIRGWDTHLHEYKWRIHLWFPH